MAIWREFPDATPFEYSCGMASPPDIGFLRSIDAVARVKALRAARAGRADLGGPVWEQCVRMTYLTLGEIERRNAEAILAAVAVVRPMPRSEATQIESVALRPRGRPAWSIERFEEHWSEASANAAPSERMSDGAVCFRRLDNTIGIDPDSLRRLRRQMRERTKISK